ncbi:MAG: hypothetical protein GYB67_04980, partial [Chloroflexi bacterium]|nr:hypothetical protein [Chloroflexota bacterium]
MPIIIPGRHHRHAHTGKAQGSGIDIHYREGDAAHMLLKGASQRPRFFLPAAPPHTSATTGAQCVAWLLTSLNRDPVADTTARDELDTDALVAALAAQDLHVERGLTTPEALHTLTAGGEPVLVQLAPPDEQPYWVMVWRRVGRRYQIADPMMGVRWVSQAALLAEVARPARQIAGSDWDQAWLAPLFSDDLRRRLAALAITTTVIDALIDQAQPSLFHLGALDAATRMTEHMITAGGGRRGPQTPQLRTPPVRAGRAPPPAAPPP